VTFEPWQVVVVPFPFSETAGSKRRPALVLSRSSFNDGGHVILAMITTQAKPPWQGDTWIEDPQSVGLTQRCLVRLKLFTLDSRLILREVGRLLEADVKKVKKNLARCLVELTA
jgi:mRNA-degrading endonuclease toxin of MazEF toxin-antitoxin module